MAPNNNNPPASAGTLERGKAMTVTQVLNAAIDAPHQTASVALVRPILGRIRPCHASLVASLIDTEDRMMADVTDDGMRVLVAEYDARAGQVMGPRCSDGGHDVARATRAGLAYVTRPVGARSALRDYVERFDWWLESQEEEDSPWLGQDAEQHAEAAGMCLDGD